MDLGLVGQRVVAQEFGYTVALTFSDGSEVRLEVPFTVRVDGDEREVTPGGGPDVGWLVGRVVVVGRADDGGGLLIEFEDGARVVAVADPDFEAWTVAGPGGFKVVSGPGGELAVWSATG